MALPLMRGHQAADITRRNALTPRLLMSTSAAVLGAAGLTFLFAPVELQRLVVGPTAIPVPPILIQLWGAAWAM